MSNLKPMKLDRFTFYTNVQLFEEIMQNLADWEELKGMVTYAMSDSYHVMDLYNYEFEPHFTMRRGGNEGIYIDLSIRGYCLMDDNDHEVRLGTIKSLLDGEYGFRSMSKLYGELLIAFEKVVHERLEELTRKGYDIHFYKEESSKNWSYGTSGCKTRERALERWEMVKENYHHAVIRDNLTREEWLVPSCESVA